MPVIDENDFFVLIHFSSLGDWETMARFCQGWLKTEDSSDHFSDASKLKSYLKDTAKSVLVEKHYHDKDYRDTFYNYYAKKFAEYPARYIRLNFFRVQVERERLWTLSDYNDDYIGFCVIRPTRIRTIGRTVFDPGKLGFVEGFIPTAKYKTHILGSPMSVRGFPYISQDSDVTICAHASCWMVFRYFSEKYCYYGEKYPYQLTQMTHDLSLGRLIPSKGLTIEQVTEIFSSFGFYPLNYFLESFQNDENTNPYQFYRLLYYYVESGLPVVAGLSSKEHAITVIGHMPMPIINEHSPSNRTSDIVRGYIVNDDNFMPYQALWAGSPTHTGHNSEYALEDIDRFVVPVYEKIYLSAEYVEDIVAQYISRNSDFRPESFGVPMNEVVTRLFLTSSRSYKRFRVNNPIPGGVDRIYRQMPMPKFIWVAELTTWPHYHDGQIIGEILIDATATPRDELSFLAIHFPTHLFVNDRNSPLFEDGDDFDLQDPGPYAMYFNNLERFP